MTTYLSDQPYKESPQSYDIYKCTGLFANRKFHTPHKIIATYLLPGETVVQLQSRDIVSPWWAPGGLHAFSTLLWNKEFDRHYLWLSGLTRLSRLRLQHLSR